MTKKPKVLFLHFPVDSNQIEALGLPNFFATKGYESYSFFEKGTRNFYSRHSGINGEIISLKRSEILSIKFDLIVCKSSSFQVYGKSFKGENTKVINITPMGLKANIKGIDRWFGEGELIKPPDRALSDIFRNNYVPYQDRAKQILVPATVWPIKNQNELASFINYSDFKGYKICFAGPIKSVPYAEHIEKVCVDKGFEVEFGHYNKEQLAKIYLNSRLVCLTSDPRPSQPFDPGPRVIFEAIAAGTPCLVNDLVLVHDYIKPFCFTYKNSDKNSFYSQIKKIKQTNMNNLSEQCYNLGETKITMENACKETHDRIMKWYQEKN